MTTDTRRTHLSLLAKQDLEQIARDGHLPGVGRRSVTTIAIDVAFWLVYGGACAVVAYVAYCAPR
jgi:hypothetical protein